MGEGDFLVAEADESDGSFLKLDPVLEVVTNIDLEHMDYYNSIEQIKSVFLEFIDKIPFYGAVILCLDDPHVASILPEIKKRFLTYGLTSQANVYAKGISTTGLNTRFEVCRENEILGEITLSLAGVHNVYNALGAVTVGLELDIPFATVAAALQSFSGCSGGCKLKEKGETLRLLMIMDIIRLKFGQPSPPYVTRGLNEGLWFCFSHIVIQEPRLWPKSSLLPFMRLTSFC